MYLGLGLGLGNRYQSSVGGAAPFVPSNLADLKLWLDASDPSTITQSGGSISQWSDKSPNGNNATQSSGTSQPITGTRTINGLNTVDFDGVNDFLTVPSGLYTISSGPNTAFVVFATDNTAIEQRIVSGASTAIRWGLVLNSGSPLTAYNGSGVTQSVTLDTLQHIFDMTRSGAFLTSCYDGVNGATGSSASDVTSTSMAIGRKSNSGPVYFDGLLGEIIMYSRALSNDDANAVRAYLKTKWNTP